MLARLSGLYTESMAAWLHRRSGLLALLDILAEPPAIPVIVLKGMALAISLYPDPALRPMHDIDLLAPADRFEEAVARLLGRGYRRLYAHAPGFEERFNHHVVLDESVLLPALRYELHRTLPFAPRLEAQSVMMWCWQHQRRAFLGEHPVAVFDPTAQLLHLAVHLAYQHSGAQSLLLWQHDIDLLWRRYRDQIEWEALLQMAKTAGWEAGLHIVLSKSVHTFATPLPSPVRIWLSQPPQALSGYRVARRMDAASSLPSLQIYERVRQVPWRSRPAYLARLLIPSAAYMQDRYRLSHPWLLPLAYPYRWLGLALDLLRTLLHRP